MHGECVKAVSCVTMDGAWESCCDDWVNRVRLDSDRASTDCWQWPCPVCCSKIGVNPWKSSVHPSTLPLQLPPHYTPPPTPTLATGLTSPHQNVRRQNRKAAVCSHHLKVHLHTLPAKSFSPPLSLPRQREWATETRDQHAHGFQLLLFSGSVCLVAFLNFFLFLFLNLTRHNISPQLSEKPKEC